MCLGRGSCPKNVIKIRYDCPIILDMGSEGSTHIGTSDRAAETSKCLPKARMRLLNANRNLHHRGHFSCPYQDGFIVMEKGLNKVRGADIHKKFLIATYYPEKAQSKRIDSA
jgi:hypothetical protein